MKRSSLLILAALGVVLSGCNWIKSLGKKDNVEPPTPLTEFTPTVQVQKLWGEGAGDGAGSSGAVLAPTVVDGRLYAASVDGTIEAIDAARDRIKQHEVDEHRERVHLDRLEALTGDGFRLPHQLGDGDHRCDGRVLDRHGR
jgi:outer membrane protein assembly factor BamB